MAAGLPLRDILEFLTRHGQLVLFAAVLAEQLGLPVPAVPVLLAAGALAGMGSLSLAGAFAGALTASLIGDALWYELGVRRGRSVLGLLCRMALEPDSCVQRTEDMYLRFGMKSLLFAKFVPGLSTVAPPLAGAFHLSRWRFVLLDGAGAFLWSGAYLMAGWLFRTQLEQLAGAAARMGAWLGVLIGLLLTAFLLVKYIQRRRLYRRLRLARITAHELNAGLASETPPIVIDLRNPADWPEGKIPGARLVRREDLAALSSQLAEGSEIVLYCT